MSEINYKTINDFYNDHKSKLTSDEIHLFEKYLNKFDENTSNDDDGLPGIDFITLGDYQITFPEAQDPSDFKVEVTKDDSEPVSIGDLSLDAIAYDEVYPTLNITKATETKPKIKPIDTRVYPDKSIVRKRRKQWGGVKTYRTYELNVGKSRGYALRSVKRLFPHVVPYSIKRATERMKRSISHLYFKVKIGPIETAEYRMTLDLFDAYEQYAHYLFSMEQEDTSAKTDAWDTYIPSNALDDFIRDTYSPTITAFAELHMKIRKFIAEEWAKYGIEAYEARQEAYGYNLTREQVSRLPSSDKSFLKEMM